jgi:hypothetical protein
MAKKLLSILVFSFLFYSCSDEKETTPLDRFLEEIEIEPQLFYASTDSIIRIKGQKGTTLTIDPNNIDFQDGEMPKEIRVELIELTTTVELLRSNVQTVSNGKWLTSGGSFKINLYEGNTPLSLKNGKTISAVFPKIRDEKMQLFYGERNEFGAMNWEPEPQFFEEELFYGILETHEITLDLDRRNSKFRPYFIEDTFIDSLGYSTMGIIRQIFVDRGVDSVSINQNTIKGYNLIAPPEYFDYDLTIDELNDSLRTDSTFFNNSELLYANVYKSIEINKLGWINIDTFYPHNEKRASCEITIDTSIDYIILYVVDRSNNTVVNIFPNNNKYIIDLPKNIGFDIIAIGSKGKSFFSSRKTVQVQGDEVLELKMEKVNENDITDIFK